MENQQQTYKIYKLWPYVSQLEKGEFIAHQEIYYDLLKIVELGDWIHIARQCNLNSWMIFINIFGYTTLIHLNIYQKQQCNLN